VVVEPLNEGRPGRGVAPAFVPGEQRRPRGPRTRLPALDGLRGIGILTVVLFHLNPSWLPGGYLGVDIFFVVSGFLITGLLLDLFGPGSSTGPALRRFWSRRARRLLPALIVLLFGVALAAGLVAHDAVPELRADIPAALVFVANWRLLLHHNNYFQAMGRPPLLQHLWSLGVEEQFYLMWPFVVLLLVRAAGRHVNRALCWVGFSGALGSALLMALLYIPGHNPSNVYYNTFTHASGLLIGTGLVGATRHRRLATGAPASKRRAQVGFVSLAGMGLMLVFLASNDTSTYRGGILLASAVTGLVLLMSLQPGPVQSLLCVRPLRYLGTRSYSLYLWHWPIICLTRPDIDVRFSGWPLLVLRLGLIGLTGEASYQLVEQPFRTGRAQEAIRAWRRRGRTVALGSAGACASVAIVLLALTNPPALSPALAAGSTPASRIHLVTAPSPSPSTTKTPSTPTTTPAGRTTTTTATAATTRVAPINTVTTAGTGPTTKPRRTVTTATPSTTSALAVGAPMTTTTAVPGRKKARIRHDYLAIGDSVMVAGSPALEQRLHGDITVDAVVGRQVWSGIARLQQYRAAGDFVGIKAIVIDLGTNGPMTPADVAQLRAVAAGVPLLVFVNVRVPRPWQGETNSSIAAVAGQPGIRVANWYAASATPGALWEDGIHPDPKGQLIYANLIAEALGAPVGP
jgi:peptidoglycan/LPS O-acetylase OafA/YrhL